MLKFSSTPVKRKTVGTSEPHTVGTVKPTAKNDPVGRFRNPAPAKKARKVRVPRKSLLLSTEKPRQIVQDYAAIDNFGELAGRKRQASERARALGHDLAGWHERSNDPAGRWNNFCATCNKLVVVCTEAPEGFPDIYGHAVTQECK